MIIIFFNTKAFGKTRRKSTPYSQFLAEEAGGEELGKLDPKSNYGSFKEPLPEEKQKSGNPFVKTKDHGSGAEEKYLQVAETSFSQAVNNLHEFFQDIMNELYYL